MTHGKFVGLVATLGIVCGGLGHAQVGSESSTRAHVEFLASDALEGREAGSAGEQRAADYLTSELSRIGAVPLPGRSDLLMPFDFTGGSRDGGSSLTLSTALAGDRSFVEPAEIRALSFSDDADVTGPVVFAGYGLVVPESQNIGYDSYATLDVQDKIVVVLRYFPEDADQQTRAVLARYADLRYKAMAARQRGARALLVVTGPRSPNAGELVPMTFDTAIAGSGIPAASISGAVADALFASAAIGAPGAATSPQSSGGTGSPSALRDAQEALDAGNPHVAGFDLPGVTLSLKTAVVRERKTARNVLAYLPATVGAEAVEKPWVVIGAHYDHLGRGGKGNSLASQDEAHAIHHGADDNASGTAAVLAIAASLSERPRGRHVLIALWSAEEIGLVGSNAFATAPPVPLDEIAAYLNFDMVGRMQDNRLIVQATGTSPSWGRVLERANVAAGFNLVVQPDPYQPTDVATFNQVEVPSLAFFTGSHEDYHKPSDTAARINFEDLDRVVGMATAVVRSIGDTIEAPQFTKVDQPVSRGSVAGLRVTTGTIPDYASDAEGLLLGGVTGGGPAERAGLTKGDLIVEIAGQTIANIYDYTYALELLRADQPVRVVYVRNGDRLETTLTPVARR
ncbi:MAG: M28 family peptidase [Acidobacteria bacterium]|nr:M28 family peptidase [Acidobacteriota bacterium]